MPPFSLARTLHWIIAATALGALISGYVLTQPGTFAVALLQIHVALGLVAGLLSALRVLVWLTFGPPTPVFQIRTSLQRRISGGVHGLLRLAPLFLVVSGLGMIAQSGAMPAIVEGSLPGLAVFEQLPPRRLHHAAALGLALLVGLHSLAAASHALRRPRSRTL